MNWHLEENFSKKELANLSDYPEIIAKLLILRGIKNNKQANEFFHQTVTYASSLLTDTNLASTKILKSIKNKEKIYIYGDYDVDGIVATSIVFDFLYRELKANVVPYIPNRFSEGYGLNAKALDTIIDEKGKLVITVDCGIRDIDLCNKYLEKGLDFVITDHHQPDENLQSNIKFPIVHPLHPKSQYPFQHISGGVVAFKLVQTLYLKAKKNKLITKKFPSRYDDLLALSTVCDVMPLIDENRGIVKKGIAKIKTNPNKGIKALYEVSAKSYKNASVYDLGFVLGPRINASGRLDNALDAVKLFVSKNTLHVNNYANKVNDLNTERQKLTQESIDEAEKKLDLSKKILFVYSSSWSEGIVGLVAGRLCEKYNRPVIVATKNTKLTVGSARSIEGFDITKALAKNKKILERFGGHAQASGFTVKNSNLLKLKKQLEKEADLCISKEMMQKKINIDLNINTKDLTINLLKKLEDFEPYGYGNPKAVFLLNEFLVVKKTFLGKDQNHVKLFLEKDDKKYSAIAFNASNKYLKIKENKSKIDIVAHTEINYWNGLEEIQFIMIDFKFNG